MLIEKQLYSTTRGLKQACVNRHIILKKLKTKSFNGLSFKRVFRVCAQSTERVKIKYKKRESKRKTENNDRQRAAERD